MKIPFLFVCEHAHVCPQKLSATGILRHITIPAVPWTLPQIFLGYEMQFDHAELQDDRDTKYQIRIRLQDQDGGKIFDHSREIGLRGKAPPGEPVSLFEALGIGHVRFKRDGPHTVTIFVNDQPVADYRFRVQVGGEKGGQGKGKAKTGSKQ